MTFATPLWLLALLPWSAAVVYLLWGRRRRVDVPFLDLWPARVEGVRVRRRATPPPIALAAAIVATLLAILAAGQPAISSLGKGEPWAVVIDRGWTMSATPSSNVEAIRPVYAEAMSRLAPWQPLDVWFVPGRANGPARMNAGDLSDGPPGDAARPTGVDTRESLNAAVRARLLHTAGPVLVFSNQPLEIDDDRIVHVVLPHAKRNAGIALRSARETPFPQIMVRVHAAGVATARLRVSSGNATAERDVSLVDTTPQDVFVDLQELGQTVKAELVVSDDQPGDNTAWLVREASWPRVEARMPLPAPLQRMLDVYARQRPAGEASRNAVIVNAVDDLAAGEAGVVVETDTPQASGPSPARIEIAEHQVTHGVSWSDVGSPGIATAEPPAGWTRLVSVGGKTWVAVREQPTRAVWVGFDMSGWARSSDFVVFWANVFNWIGSGGEQFASHPVGLLDGNWTPIELAPSALSPEAGLWPGLYRRADGILRTLHAPATPQSQVPNTPWQDRLERWRRETTRRLPLAPIFLIISLICIGITTLLWKKKEGTPHKAFR